MSKPRDISEDTFQEIDLEKGSRPPPSFTENSEAPNRENDFFNYHPPMFILISTIAVWILLLLVCFLSPNGGLNPIIRDGGDYIGVLRKCSESSCEAWMATSQSGGSSSLSGTSKSTSSSGDSIIDKVGNTVGSVTSSDSSSSSSSSGSSSKRMLKRASANPTNLSNFYLTTGLACLACFWLMTYTLFFIIIRYFSKSIPDNNHLDINEIKKKNENLSFRKRIGQAIKSPLKRFSFRTSRIFLFFINITMLAVAMDATITVFNITGAGGLGMGVFILHFCWILLLLMNIVEINRGKLRKKADTSIWGCKCFQFCRSYNKRARAKWEGYNEQHGGDRKDRSQDDSRRKGDYNESGFA